MKILHVIRTLNPAWGGPVEGVRSLVQEALVRRYDSEVVCVDDPSSSWLATWNVPVHAIAGNASRYGKTKDLDTWLVKNIERFDAVVSHGIWMYFSYAVWKATRKVRRPYFLFIHGALDPWFKKRYPLKHLKKNVYWKLFEWKVLRDASAVLFTTEEEMSLAQNAFSPYRCRPAVVGFGISGLSLRSGFDQVNAVRDLTAKHAILRQRRFILSLSRIHEKKGIDLLLRAFASAKKSLPNTALVIAGPGDSVYCSFLERLSESLGLSNDVVWAGPVYGDAKIDLMRAAEVYALPSHQENFGISIVESLCCGTPVLISDKVNIWREVKADSAGLVEPDSLEGTIRLIYRWTSVQPSVRSEMAQNAQLCFRSRFDISAVSGRFFGLLQEYR